MRPAAPRGARPWGKSHRHREERSPATTCDSPSDRQGLGASLLPKLLPPHACDGVTEAVSRKQKALEIQGLSAFANWYLARVSFIKRFETRMNACHLVLHFQICPQMCPPVHFCLKLGASLTARNA